jgi:hypothetical protein
VELVTQEAEPEKRLAGEPDERLAEIRARSTERYDAYDCDTRWLLHYVDMLREHDGQLTKRRLSFETKMFTTATLLVGLAVVGVIAYDLYLQPAYEISRACAA